MEGSGSKLLLLHEQEMLTQVQVCYCHSHIPTTLSLSLSLLLCNTLTPTYTHVLSCSVFKQHLDLGVIYQHWHGMGDSSHYTYPTAHKHTQMHIHYTYTHRHTLIHSARNTLMRLWDHRRTILIFVTTQLRWEALHMAHTMADECFRAALPTHLDKTHNIL